MQRRFDGDDNLSKVLLAIANIKGCKTSRFCAHEGLVTTGLSGLTT